MTSTYQIPLPGHLVMIWFENHLSNLICREIDQELLDKIQPGGIKLPPLTSMQEWLTPEMNAWCDQVGIRINISSDQNHIILEFDNQDCATMFALRWF
jgi:hypothetical protein